MVIKKSFSNPLFQRFKAYLNLSNIKVYRYWKIKPQWWNTTKIQDLWDRAGQRHKYTHRGSDSTHKTCTNSSRTKSTLNGRGGQPASPWAEQILTADRSWEPGNQVFKSTVPDKVTILQWKSTHPKLYSQHKLNSKDLNKNEKTQSWASRLIQMYVLYLFLQLLLFFTVELQ